MVHNYLSNLRPRVTLGGEEFVRVRKGSKGNGGHGVRARTTAHGDVCTSTKRRRDQKVRLCSICLVKEYVNNCNANANA